MTSDFAMTAYWFRYLSNP